jgi:hypothetical protein
MAAVHLMHTRLCSPSRTPTPLGVVLLILTVGILFTTYIGLIRVLVEGATSRAASDSPAVGGIFRLPGPGLTRSVARSSVPTGLKDQGSG